MQLMLAPSMLALSAVQQQAPGASEVSFSTELSVIEAELEGKQYAHAKAAIADLLVAHEPHGYVLACLPRVVEDLELAAFGSTHQPPDPKKLVSGELLSYSASGYDFKLRYTPQTLGDFIQSGNKGPSQSGGEPWTLVHPLVFAGPCSVEISGALYPAPGGFSNRLPMIVAGWEHGDGFAVNFGLIPTRVGGTTYSADASLRYTGLGNVQGLDINPSRVVGGKRGDFKVRLENNTIWAAYNGTKLLSGKKPDGVFGQIAIAGFDDFESIILQGRAEPSWMQGRLDAEIEKQRREFAHDFKLEAELPKWLQLEPCGAFISILHSTESLPGPARDGQPKMLLAARAYAEKEQWAEGLAFAKQLADESTTEEFRCWLRAAFHQRTGAVNRSAKECDRLLELSPKFRPARVLRAELKYMQRKREEAVADYRQLLQEDASDRRVRALLARCLLLLGRGNELDVLVREAASAGTYSAELNLVNGVRSKSLRGPAWSKRYESTSKHYRVASDINQATCIEIADRLETALANVQRRFQPPKSQASEPYRVYVFSGEESYKRYAASTLSGAAENTWGMYSATLKHLLLWNVPDRDDMFRTARHEGFHQYLDSVIADAPYWFNEGLADYFASADYTKASSDEILLNPSRLAQLRARQEKLVALSEFLRMVDAETFYGGDVTLHYAQAWAFLHFLQHTTPSNRNLVFRMFEALQGGASSLEAIDRVFAGTDLGLMQREFQVYVAKLCGT